MGRSFLGSLDHRGASSSFRPIRRRLIRLAQVFHASDTDMQDLALHTFRSLYATLYPDHLALPVEETHASDGADVEMSSAADAEDDEIEGVAVKAVLNSLDELQEPDKNNAKPAVRILTAFIAASSASTDHLRDLPS